MDEWRIAREESESHHITIRIQRPPSQKHARRARQIPVACALSRIQGTFGSTLVIIRTVQYLSKPQGALIDVHLLLFCGYDKLGEFLNGAPDNSLGEFYFVNNDHGSMGYRDVMLVSLVIQLRWLHMLTRGPRGPVDIPARKAGVIDEGTSGGTVNQIFGYGYLSDGRLLKGTTRVALSSMSVFKFDGIFYASSRANRADWSPSLDRAQWRMTEQNTASDLICCARIILTIPGPAVPIFIVPVDLPCFANLVVLVRYHILSPILLARPG